MGHSEGKQACFVEGCNPTICIAKWVLLYVFLHWILKVDKFIKQMQNSNANKKLSAGVKMISQKNAGILK